MRVCDLDLGFKEDKMLRQTLAIFAVLLAKLWANEAESSLLKQGFYKSVGIGGGYYYYGEVIRNDEFFMRLDNLVFNLAGNVGYITRFGLKLDAYIDANFALGIYTGGVQDTVKRENNGRYAMNASMSTYYHAQTLLGYNFLAFLTPKASLYLQAGGGYYFNRHDLNSYERLQGYVYVPIELESEIVLNDKWALNLMGGFKYFIFGHHLTQTTKQHFDRDFNASQKNGLGASGFVGARYRTKSGEINSFGLRYEYWHIGHSSIGYMTDYAGNYDGAVEPKNTSHIVTFQYAWEF